MRALKKTAAGEGLTWVEDAPLPEIGPNDVLVRVEKTAICGTDLHIWKWDEWAAKTVPLDMTVGHEFMGRVEKVGARVGGFKPGQRVSAEGHITCGYCRNCRAGTRHLCPNTQGIGVNRPGCFADFVSVPKENIYPLADYIPDDWGAILDPFGNATHTALSFDLVGEDVLITGAGPIGVMAIAVAKRAGARHVVVSDLNPYRLELAKTLGATRVVNPTEEKLSDVMTEMGMTEGFDVGLEMSGAPTAFDDMLHAMRAGGKIALLGILPSGAGIDWDAVIFKGLTIKGIYGREIFETWYKMDALIRGGIDLAPVITHRVKAADYADAFKTLASGESGKIIMDWT
jgi:threonine 3-dehydrogenase